MNIFDSWTPESAYLLGLFYADGHLTSDCRSATLTTKDKQLSELVYSLIPNSVANFSKPIKRVRLNKQLANGLQCMGLPPGRKSEKLEWPKELPPRLARDFIRGFFDGDGSAISGRPCIHFNSNSIALLLSIEYIGRALSCYHKTLIWSRTCYKLIYCNLVDAALWSMYMYLYPTTDICLLRKRESLFSSLGVKKIPETPDIHNNLTYRS